MSLYEIALTYVGTPHINGGNVKGAGLDCCTLVTSIYKEWLGVDIPISFGYSSDWFCKQNCEEMVLPYLEKYFEPVHTLKEGDLISYKWGRSNCAHLSMYLESNTVIHSQVDIGTEITDLENPYFFYANGKTRATGIWRLKNEFIQRD